MPLRSGTLDKRATFRKLAADAGDGMGGQAKRAWVNQFTRAASLIAERGQEARDAGRQAAEQMATLTVRDDAQTQLIAADWSVAIRYRGQTTFWNIRSINGFDRRSGTISMAIERGVAV